MMGLKITTIECYSSNSFEIMETRFIVIHYLVYQSYYANIITNVLQYYELRLNRLAIYIMHHYHAVAYYPEFIFSGRGEGV